MNLQTYPSIKHEYRITQTSRKTPDYNVDDTFGGSDEVAVQIASDLTAVLKELFAQCDRDGVPLRDVEIAWMNTRNTDHNSAFYNPLGKVGFFNFRARRCGISIPIA